MNEAEREELKALSERFSQLSDDQRAKIYRDKKTMHDIGFVFSGTKALIMAFGGTTEQVEKSKLEALRRIVAKAEEA